MRKFTLYMLFIFSALQVSAQLNYTAFNAQNFSGIYTDLGTSGTVIATANKDNANSSAQNIGFNFDFNGSSFTQFILNTNGFIKLGNTPPSIDSLFFSTPNGYVDGVFNSTNAADVNILSPFNNDLIGISPNAEYRVNTSGSAPNRVCTVQYKKLKDKKIPPYSQYDSIDFQIKLYESTNFIEFIYGNWYASADSSRFRSSACGLKGNVGGTTNQLLTVTKGSTQSFDLASFIDGNYTGNAFNYGNANAGDGSGPNGGRPMMDFGRTLRFIPVFPKDLGVDLIIAQGELAIPFGLPHTYRARVSNAGLLTVNNAYVTLEVTGANTYKDSVMIASFAPSTTQLVSFPTYVPANLGVDNLKVSITSDDYNGNNQLNFRQEVTNTNYSHVDTTKAPNGVLSANPTASGIMVLHKYHITGKRKVIKIGAFISNQASNVGRPIYGAVFDNTGALMVRSDDYIIQALDLNTWKEFEINLDPLSLTRMSPPTVNNLDFYAGVAITPNPVPFQPIGHTVESPVRPNSFFYSPLAGGTVTEFTSAAGLNFAPHIRAVVGGNNLMIQSTTLKNPSCQSSNKVIDVVIKNTDSSAIDFSIDTLFLSITSTGAITQSFSAVISSGTLAKNATQTFNITNNFDLSLNGIYNVDIRALTRLELDTIDNIKKMNVEVIGTPGVTLKVSPDSVICNGIPYTFIAVPFTAGSKLYQWKINGANSGAPTTDSSLMPTLNYGDEVTVDLITDHCTTAPFTITSNAIVMKINPQPKLISGLSADTIRENTTKSYAIGQVTGSTYLWKANGGTIIGDSTTSGVTVSWGSANPTAHVSVTERDNKNCVITHLLPVNVTSTVGLGEHSRAYLGEAYPNPANQSVIIPVFLNESQKIELSLYDITGKKVQQVYNGEADKERKFELNVSELNEGLYFYKLTGADGYQSVKKLTIRH